MSKRNINQTETRKCVECGKPLKAGAKSNVHSECLAIALADTTVDFDSEDAKTGEPIRSFIVTSPATIGGRVEQPPIDEDEVVYFDGFDLRDSEVFDC